MAQVLKKVLKGLLFPTCSKRPPIIIYRMPSNWPFYWEIRICSQSSRCPPVSGMWRKDRPLLSGRSALSCCWGRSGGDARYTQSPLSGDGGNEVSRSVNTYKSGWSTPDPPENWHLTVKKLPKTWQFFQQNCQNFSFFSKKLPLAFF